MRIGPGWAWSPVADCAVRVAKNGALFSTVVNPSKIPPVWGTTLANRGVESFAFSPDGSKLGLVLGSRRNRAIAIADLHTRSVEVVRRFRFPTCCISLGGWTPDSRFLLYWAASGASVAADGSPLEGIAMDGERIDLTPVKGKRFSSLARVTVPRPDALETCGDRLVGVLGGARFLVEATQITTLYPLTAKGPISTGDFSDVDPSCSESGELMAVARGEVKRRSGVRLERWLVLLDASARGGQAVRNLTPVGGPSEESSEWGPPGTGSIFVQRAGDDAELWYLAEGARAPQPVGVRVVDRWSSWDWSATPPTGLPAGQ